MLTQKLLSTDWKTVLMPETEKEYFKRLEAFVSQAYAENTIFPPQHQIFEAFAQCNLLNTKVVILGQDPYHDNHQAHGLCFSVNKGIGIPPSLRNIFKEIERDLGFAQPTSGKLTHWAQQGVLLLNATLTVEAHKAGSHQKKGWETFSDAVIKAISDQKQAVVFMLWGAYAHKKATLIDSNKHLVLQAVHPSPLSAHRGFIGCGHFSAANKFLRNNNIEEIVWGENTEKQQFTQMNIAF
jgi:uracil-DNA glycosylase